MAIRSLSKLLVVLSLVLGANQASAVLFNASYERGGDIISFMFDGNIEGDMDTVVVNSILMTPLFNGAAPAGPDISSTILSTTEAVFGVPVGDPVLLSFSGATMNFAYFFNGSDDNFFGFGDFEMAPPTFRSSGAYNSVSEGFEPLGWNLTLKEIPEPTVLSLLALSVAGLARTGRNRRK